MLSSEEQWELELSQTVENYLLATPTSGRTLKVRLDVFRDGQTKLAFAPVPATTCETLYPKILPAPEEVELSSIYDAVLDWMPTKITPFTYLKTANRDEYDQARSRMVETMSKVYGGAKIMPLSEIILHNPDGEVTEGSFTNVYFWRNSQWITPPVGSEVGGLEGVARRWALETKLCEKVDKVKLQDVKKELVFMSNAVRGFFLGRIVYPVS
jgi:4-amino-4-deoxychorismate lyase